MNRRGPEVILLAGVLPRAGAGDHHPPAGGVVGEHESDGRPLYAPPARLPSVAHDAPHHVQQQAGSGTILSSICVGTRLPIRALPMPDAALQLLPETPASFNFRHSRSRFP
jgi:hypothetical protein